MGRASNSKVLSGFSKTERMSASHYSRQSGNVFSHMISDLTGAPPRLTTSSLCDPHDAQMDV